MSGAIDLMAALKESLNRDRCEAVHYRKSMRCRLAKRHEGQHLAGHGFGELRWPHQHTPTDSQAEPSETP